MLHKILKLEGAHSLSKKEQKIINGGAKVLCCDPEWACCIPNPSPMGCRFLYSSGACI